VIFWQNIPLITAKPKQIMLWAMPWEVLCSREHDPVTTEPKGEAAIPVITTAHGPMANL
jgi:hypothetical protein